MLDNNITLTLDGAAVVLSRTGLANSQGQFVGRSADGLTAYTLYVKQTVPTKLGTKATTSHLVQLVADRYANVDGVITSVRSESVHEVIKTTGSGQVDTTIDALHDSLVSFVNTNLAALLNGNA